MTRWRWSVAALLGLLFLPPLLLPFLNLAWEPGAWRVWREWDRLLPLAVNSLALVVGSLFLAAPPGILCGLVLQRATVALPRFLRGLVLVSLFVPLPLLATAWQAIFGWTGLLTFSSLPDPAQLPGAPWNRGLGPAIVLHAVAVFPWIVLLAGLAFAWVEPELEEDALLAAGWPRVLSQVTLRRSQAGLGAALLWAALLTLNEITVTDLMQVRTYPEEVYTQFVVGDRGALARALAVSLPLVVAITVLVTWTAARWERHLPARDASTGGPVIMSLGFWRWPASLMVLGILGVLAAIPVVGLTWKAGLSGTPPTWSVAAMLHSLGRAVTVRGGLLGESVLLALGVGCLAALLALIACWLARESASFRFALLALIACIWSMPGPILGLGMRETISAILAVCGADSWAATALYYGPSPLPVLWIHCLRFFPAAVVLLWPVVRLLPTDLLDAGRVDGLTPRQELVYLIWPLTRSTVFRVMVAVAILSLGELSAGKLVETPGSQTFAHEVFAQMHYGVSSDLAALCLLLLGIVLMDGALWAWWTQDADSLARR